MTDLSISTQSLVSITELSLCKKKELFTSLEISNSSNLTLAGKLAAKNAFLKCLGINTPSDSLYNCIEVLRHSNGRPFIKTSDSFLLAKLSNRKISLSISHTKNIAIAICIVYNK